MSTIVKVLVTILAILLLFGGLIAAGSWFWWSNYGEDFLQQTISAQNDGEEFGKRADNQACVTEAFAQIEKCDGVSCEVSVNVFLSSCLPESRPSPGFCDDVPSMTDFVATAKWRMASCLEEFRAMESCQQIHGTIQEYCADRARSET
jgi:hypothetical protein